MASQVISVDNIAFHVRLEGPPSAPLVVLSHALMANLSMWDATVPALHALGYSTLRYDHIGHGGTQQFGTREYTFEDFTRHIHALVKAATGEQRGIAAIAGCSMGGVLAMRYAMLYPDYVDAVMCCDAPGMTAMESAKAQWRERVEQFARGEEGKEELCKATVVRWLPGDEERDEIARQKALSMVRACSFEGYKMCAHAISNFDYTSELCKVQKQKVMVLVGDRDSAVGPPEVLQGVAAKVGKHGGEYMVVETAGHLPPVHRPDDFNNIVKMFLDKA